MGGTVYIGNPPETLAERVRSAGYTPEMLEGEPFIDIVSRDSADTHFVGVVSDDLGPLGVSLRGLKHEARKTDFGSRLTRDVFDRFYLATLDYEDRMETIGELETSLDTVELGFDIGTVFWAYFGVEKDTPIKELASRSTEAGVAS